MLDELDCDKCGKHLGWVQAFDLEGSDFYCDACRDELLKEVAGEADSRSVP
jgi:hypothetical protein